MGRIQACADCGTQRQAGTGSLPEGMYRCLTCRRARPGHTQTKKRNACLRCGEPCFKLYCSNRCSALATSRRIRSDNESRVQRRQRVAAAPGLTEYGIQRLAEKWKRQGRNCTYCSAPATTADHVLPLVRGGTNYEGNLTPCCKSCNSRKSALTLIEWRTGRRLGQMTATLDSLGRRRPARTPKPIKFAEAAPLMITCATCGDWMDGRRRHPTCAACRYDTHRTLMRERYRERHGIDTDSPRRSTTRGPSAATLASF